MKPLCVIETPFREKFGVPRQSLLIHETQGIMRFPRGEFFDEAFRGIENFSHLWLIFEFHLVPVNEIKALIRPPRYQGKKKFGVFATRSPHRPNRLGLSVVKFHELRMTDKEVVLEVRGVDLVSGTPIYDIKPYLPYADHIPDARAMDFQEMPTTAPVEWPAEMPLAPEDQNLIKKVIALDPRPGHQKDSGEEYGVSVAGYNIRFRSIENKFVVLKVTKE
jgi:tRNA (adenine37-N6)-methyltransferase